MIVTSMYRFILLGITLVVALSESNIVRGTDAFLLSGLGPTPRRCVYSKIYNMLQARCADLNLSEIPPNLQKDVQILDLSINRLRELRNESLSSFTSLSYLYIMDNFILIIGNDTFRQLRNLQVLDMTKNGFSDFPKNILELPQLKKLYLGNNNLGDAALDLTSFPVNPNIEFLELSNNHLTKLPKLGFWSQLKLLNVSGNKIRTITAKEIARFCSLEVLDISENPLLEDCDCHEVNLWIDYRQIKMTPTKLECHSCLSSRRNSTIANETLVIFQSCQNVLKVREGMAKARIIWIVVLSSAAIFFICLFIFLYCIHKRNNKNKLRRRNSKQLNHGDGELLNVKHTTE